VNRILELAKGSKGNNSTLFANIYQLITGTFGTEVTNFNFLFLFFFNLMQKHF